MSVMGFLDRLRGRSTDMRRTSGGFTTVRTADSADAAHLEDFVRTRQGVEAYLEPRTAVSDVTVLLVAHDGEWTRRRVQSTEWAHKFADRHRIGAYDAGVVGYPARMREYNRRKKAGEP
jgi:Ser/Thr protein kinase RdoA (MazF antagonist)